MLGELHNQVTRVSVVAFVVLMVGCSPSKQTAAKDDQGRTPQKAPLSYYETTLNPSDYDEEIAALQKHPAEVPTREELTIPKDSVVVEEEASEGFRIQIFASASIDEANAARSLALQKLPEDSVYVVYDPPVYKVRVGDFPTRYDASQRLPSLIDRGYPDAWVVQDRILQRRITRIPR